MNLMKLPKKSKKADRDGNYKYKRGPIFPLIFANDLRFLHPNLSPLFGNSKSVPAKDVYQIGFSIIIQ